MKTNTLRHLRRIQRKHGEKIYLTLGLMMIVLIVGLVMAPSDEKVIKNEITITTLETNQLKQDIEAWRADSFELETKIREAQMQIQKNQKQISLLSEVYQ